MSESPSPVSPSIERPLPGTGRVGVVSAYFLLTGAYATFIAGTIAVAILRPSLTSTTLPANPWSTLAAVSSLACGCLRTSWLLDRRRKAGAIDAGLFVLGPLAGYVTGSPPGVLMIGIAALGVTLLASVWRHLR